MPRSTRLYAIRRVYRYIVTMKLYMSLLQICFGILIGIIATFYSTGKSYDGISQLQVTEKNLEPPLISADRSISANSVDNETCFNPTVPLDQDTFDQIKREVRKAVSEEFQLANDRHPQSGQQRKTRAATEELTPEQQQLYEYAKSLIQLAVETGGVTLKDIETKANVAELPLTLRRQLLSEIFVKINSGELDADSFLGRR